MTLPTPAASLDSGKAVVRGASGVPQPAVFRLDSPAPDSGLGGWPATSRGTGKLPGYAEAQHFGFSEVPGLPCG